MSGAWASDAPDAPAFLERSYGALRRASCQADGFRDLGDRDRRVLGHEAQDAIPQPVLSTLFRAERLHRIADGREHEGYEGGRGSGRVRFVQCGVVRVLALPDHAFDRQPGEHGAPSSQQQRVPEPSDAAVSVGERVDEFELVMEYARSDARFLALPKFGEIWRSIIMIFHELKRRAPQCSTFTLRSLKLSL